MSLLHAAIRTTLRTALKPLARPEVPLRLQRLLLENAARTMRTPRGLRVETTRLGGIPARRLVPAGGDDTRHVLYLHGGAYVQGSAVSHTPLAGQVAQAAGATVWLIDYRLAPEHPYPAAVEDAVAACRALQAHGRIALAGDSAGGGLCLATTLALRAQALPLPAALALYSPWTDLTLSARSLRDRYEAEPMLNPPWLDWAAGLYCGDASDRPSTLRTDPGVSPLFADLTGFPPLLVHVGADEVLLDDSTLLARRAAQAGVDVTLRVFDGLWHVFQAQAGLIREADESIAATGAFLRRHLDR